MKKLITSSFCFAIVLNFTLAQQFPEGFEKKYFEAVAFHQKNLNDSISHYTILVNNGLRQLQNDYKIHVASADIEKQIPQLIEYGFSNKFQSYHQLPLVTGKRTQKIADFEFKHRQVYLEDQKLLFLKEIIRIVDSLAMTKSKLISSALHYRGRSGFGGLEKYTDKDSLKAISNFKISVESDLGTFCKGFSERFTPLKSIQRLDLTDERKLSKHSISNFLKIKKSSPTDGQNNVYYNSNYFFSFEFDSTYSELKRANYTAIILQDQAGYFEKQIVTYTDKIDFRYGNRVTSTFENFLRPNSIYKLMFVSDSSIFKEIIFRTSKYGTFKEKVSKATLQIDTVKGIGKFLVDEAFDSFEISDSINLSNLRVASDMLLKSPCAIDPNALLYIMTYPSFQNLDSLKVTDKLIHERDNSLSSPNFYKTEPTPKSYQSKIRPNLTYLTFSKPKQETEVGRLVQNVKIEPIKPEDFYTFKVFNKTSGELTFNIDKISSWTNEYLELKQIIDKRQKERAEYFYKIDQFISKRDGKPTDKTYEYFYNQEVANFNISLTNILKNCPNFVIGTNTKFFLQSRSESGSWYNSEELKK